MKQSRKKLFNEIAEQVRAFTSPEEIMSKFEISKHRFYRALNWIDDNEKNVNMYLYKDQYSKFFAYGSKRRKIMHMLEEGASAAEIKKAVGIVAVYNLPIDLRNKIMGDGSNQGGKSKLFKQLIDEKISYGEILQRLNVSTPHYYTLVSHLPKKYRSKLQEIKNEHNKIARNEIISKVLKNAEKIDTESKAKKLYILSKTYSYGTIAEAFGMSRQATHALVKSFQDTEEVYSEIYEYIKENRDPIYIGYQIKTPYLKAISKIKKIKKFAIANRKDWNIDLITDYLKKYDLSKYNRDKLKMMMFDGSTKDQINAVFGQDMTFHIAQMITKIKYEQKQVSKMFLDGKKSEVIKYILNIDDTDIKKYLRLSLNKEKYDSIIGILDEKEV